VSDARQRIALDAMGSDHGPRALVEGALIALRADPSIEVILVGKQGELRSHMRDLGMPDRKPRIVNATEVASPSTCTACSIARTHASAGLIPSPSPPTFFIATRTAASYTTHGTPVQPCTPPRPGMKGLSLALTDPRLYLPVP